MGIAPDDEETLDRAADLGIAFQLANIARDLTEDARVGRVYLPVAWLEEAGLTAADLAAPEKSAALAGLAARLAQLEARYRASAKVGAARLPFRCRWAVLAAAPMVIVLPERRLLALSLSALVTISRDGASSWPCSPGRSTRGPAGP